jgi:hypothetical protein
MEKQIQERTTAYQQAREPQIIRKDSQEEDNAATSRERHLKNRNSRYMPDLSTQDRYWHLGEIK